MELDTLETVYPTLVTRLGIEGQEAMMALIPRALGGWAHLPNSPVTIPAAVDATPLVPFVNHGQWIVQCPDCNGAQEASANDHRFWCCDCLNAGVGGAWRPVAWPLNAAAIEAALVVRPRKVNRNWRLPETVPDLLAENIAMGVG